MGSQLPAVDARDCPRDYPLREMSRFAGLVRQLASPQATIYFFEKFDADLVYHVNQPAKMIFGFDELRELDQQPAPSFVVVRPNQYQAIRQIQACCIGKR